MESRGQNGGQAGETSVFPQGLHILQDKVGLHLIPEPLHFLHNLLKRGSRLCQLLDFKTDQSLSAASRIGIKHIDLFFTGMFLLVQLFGQPGTVIGPAQVLRECNNLSLIHISRQFADSHASLPVPSLFRGSEISGSAPSWGICFSVFSLFIAFFRAE